MRRQRGALARLATPMRDEHRAATATRYDSVACDEMNFSSSEERALALLSFSFPEECCLQPLGLSPPEERALAPLTLVLQPLGRWP